MKNLKRRFSDAIMTFVFFFLLTLCAMTAWAQAAGATSQEISFGQYALPVILMVVLSFVYKVAGQQGDTPGMISNRFKPIIAIFIGVGLGIVALFYNAIAPITFKVVVDYVLYGFMTGCSAIGLWEGFKATAGK